MKKESTEDNSVITVDEILLLLKQYRIGKKPLSKLLGWGETTIIRYIDGDTPTNEYSDKLKFILYHPNYYYEILVRNKDKLTGIAYRKSRGAVIEKLMESRIHVAAQYVINLCQAQISAAELVYLLYYVQCFHLAFYEEEVFEEDYMITDNNVPYPDLYEDLRQRVPALMDVNASLLKASETEVMKQVVSAFRWYGLETMRAMMNAERTVLRISRDKDNQRVIGKSVLRMYFQNVLEQYGIHGTKYICLYPDKRIIDIKNLDV